MKKYYCGIGWKLNTPSHLEYFEEVGYALASKGYTLRTSGNKGGSLAFIKGAERYCKKNNKKIDDFIEVYLPNHNFNGLLADRPGFKNIQFLKKLSKAKEITKSLSTEDLTLFEKDFLNYCTIPYICLGEELNHPVQFLITDIKLYEMNSANEITDGHGLCGQAIRTLRQYSPNSFIFNFDYEEHRKRINTLIYMATQQ